MIKNPGTVKQWLWRSIRWGLSLHGSWWALFLMRLQIEPVGNMEQIANAGLILSLFAAHAMSWTLASLGLNQVMHRDSEVGFWVSSAANVWQVLLAVYQILGLPLLLFITLFSSGMPPQD